MDALEASPSETAEVPAGLHEAIAEARADLAARLGMADTEIRLLDAVWVTWGNGALGCPEPGGLYTQALVPGYRIRLIAADRIHHYHGARDRPPFWCPPERVGKALPDEDRGLA